MNNYLNHTIQESMQPGRTRMSYVHLHERDSFYALSPYGQEALPSSLQRRQNREPRVRITIDEDPKKEPHARNRPRRIVKVPINNLHIFNPHWNYDCRISINLEVNLDRPDLDPDALISQDPKQQQFREVDRKKDRVSYKHLAYSIDLTKVEREGLGATYELELEVDSTLLREQMRLMSEGKPHAFGDVVGGFLDNATFLMRQGPAIQR